MKNKTIKIFGIGAIALFVFLTVAPVCSATDGKWMLGIFYDGNGNTYGKVQFLGGIDNVRLLQEGPIYFSFPCGSQSVETSPPS